MAFKASTSIAAKGYVEAKVLASSLKNLSQNINNQMAVGNVSGNLIIEYFSQLIYNKNRFTGISQIPKIADYAKTQEDDATYDVIAEFNNMLVVINETIDWIVANFPSVGGYIKKDIIDSTGLTVRQFTPVETAGLRIKITNIINAIS